MILKEEIEYIVNEKLAGASKFLVHVHVKPGNKIEVFLDDDQAISISDCIEVSRWVESKLDREKEDYELSVMSAGVGEPLLVTRQYKKNIGRQIEILNSEGQKLIGKLISANEEQIEIQAKLRKDKKKPVPIIISVPYNQIKKAKIVISF
jgi:ribosome maturation factor RimP